MSGVTDPYQPGERRLRITRRCLEVLAEFRNPVGLITKNRLVTRDIDLLSEMARWNGAAVFLSVTTLDPQLSGVLEPRASRPAARLEAIRRLADAGVPVGVSAAPMIPGLTDHEVPAIVAACAAAGATFGTYGVVRLPGAVEGLFDTWLATHRPGHRAKVMNRIRGAHGGRANDTSPGTRMKGDGPHADQIRGMWLSACRTTGLRHGGPWTPLDTSRFRRPPGPQADLFDA